MSKAQEFVDKVRSRRSNELGMGIESHEMRMWIALADAIEELSNPKCCDSYPNGPQWGHEFSCSKCPD